VSLDDLAAQQTNLFLDGYLAAGPKAGAGSKTGETE